MKNIPKTTATEQHVLNWENRLTMDCLCCCCLRHFWAYSTNKIAHYHLLNELWKQNIPINFFHHQQTFFTRLTRIISTKTAFQPTEYMFSSFRTIFMRKKNIVCFRRCVFIRNEKLFSISFLLFLQIEYSLHSAKRKLKSIQIQEISYSPWIDWAFFLTQCRQRYNDGREGKTFVKL